MTARLFVGDCRAVMATMPAESVDSFVTDPPYGIGFMGKKWDVFNPDFVAANDARRKRKGTTVTSAKFPGKVSKKAQSGGVPITYDESPRANREFQEWCTSWAVEAFRLLKPGGILLCFGGTRTFHRMTCGIEDAGFEIRDCLMWLYGSGFPKSLDIGKAIDAAAGAEREVVGENRRRLIGGTDGASTNHGRGGVQYGIDAPTAPATELAAKWDGWGTALKPAWEPIIVARKPFRGNVATNVLLHGTGGLNIDGCRIESEPGRDFGLRNPGMAGGRYGSGYGLNTSNGPHARTDVGRWPANVILDEAAAAMLDESAGDRRAGNQPARRRGIGFTENSGGTNAGTAAEMIPLDSGGASRFYYCAKADPAERDLGLHGLDRRNIGVWGGDEDDLTHKPTRKRANSHPTVKPAAVMQWLCRLVTPPGGRILDPFVGSGSTGIGAAREHFDFDGIDLSPEYIEFSRLRIIGDAPMFNTASVVDWEAT